MSLFLGTRLGCARLLCRRLGLGRILGFLWVVGGLLGLVLRLAFWLDGMVI